MKILGETTTGFIIEATHNEVARIRGFYYDGSTGYQRPAIGWEYKVGEIWEQLNTIRTNNDRLSKMARELRTYADLLEYKELEVNRVAGNMEEAEAAS